MGQCLQGERNGMEISKSKSKTMHTTKGIKRRSNNVWNVKEQTKWMRLNTMAALVQTEKLIHKLIIECKKQTKFTTKYIKQQ